MWIYILCSIVWAIIVVFTIVQIARRTDFTQQQKIIWMVFIVIAPVVGLLIYYFTATPKKLV